MSRRNRRFTQYVVLLVFYAIVSACPPGYGGTFSFAVFADPHIDGKPDHMVKFETAVDWVIDNRDCRDIELVFVLGDIAWGGHTKRRNLQTAKAVLDQLSTVGILYIPIVGDNEIQAGCDKEFQDVFNVQYTSLAKTLDNWQKLSTPVAGMYLQNFSFDYKGCHFVCPDFNPRKTGDEGGELHDFPGGTWPWFKNDIEQCPKPKKRNIMIMTHVGMFHTGFGFADKFLLSEGEMEKIRSFLYPYRGNVDSNYAGHLHVNWDVPVWSGFFVELYHIRVTDETWSKTQWPEIEDYGLTVRRVQVDNSGLHISYSQHIEDVGKHASVEK
ncbi:MAG: metallophosphoesterase family protein [Planctomycetota bacterium]